MKTLWIIFAVIVVLGVGGYAIVNHNNKNSNGTAPATSSSTNEYGQSNSSKQAEASGTTNGGSSSTSQSNAVTISNFAFSPADISVKKGTTVTWTNKDSVAHTVTETDGQNGPKSTDLNQGQTYSFTYSTTGTFKYHCSIHPTMVGTVTVTD